MPVPFQFAQELVFEAARAAELVRQIPARPGIFALFGADPAAKPYLTRAADIRRRIARLVGPPNTDAAGKVVESKRLNLSSRVARIAWTVAGSEFEALLALHSASSAIFGAEEARRRLRLYAPFCARFSGENRFPRLYSTNRFGRRNLSDLYGPFQSHLAADRYVDAVLDLFKLRRCWEELTPYPEHPGCIYGEMNKCLAPCKERVDQVTYGVEAGEVKAFLDSRGESMLAAVERERESASEELDFERAAAAHERYTKVKVVTALAAELVRPLPLLRAVIVQRAAVSDADEQGLDAAVFLVAGGCVVGPERLSTLGVRAVKEQTSVGSSLFAQPLMLQAVVLEEEAGLSASAKEDSVRGNMTLNPEARANAVLAVLEARAEAAGAAELGTLTDHLSLLRRWYYRPEKQRAGEILFPNADGSWPVRRVLNAAARVVLGTPAAMAETQREAAPAVKQKLLHGGREGVERMVPDLAAADLPAAPAEVQSYRSRRRTNKAAAG